MFLCRQMEYEGTDEWCTSSSKLVTCVHLFIPSSIFSWCFYQLVCSAFLFSWYCDVRFSLVCSRMRKTLSISLPPWMSRLRGSPEPVVGHVGVQHFNSVACLQFFLFLTDKKSLHYCDKDLKLWFLDYPLLATFLVASCGFFSFHLYPF